MKLPIFHVLKRPTLFLLSDAAKKIGFEPHLIHFKDLEVSFSRKGVIILAGGIPLSAFPVIFVREVRDYMNEMAIITKYCFSNRIPIIDSAFLESPGWGGKLGLMTCNAFDHLPLPITFFSQDGTSPEKIIKELKLPIVAKDNRGQQGRNVFLLKTKKEFTDFYRRITARKKNLATKIFFFQEFIPADSDVRVLVLGGRVLGAMERKNMRRGEFRHNVARGALAKQIRVTKEMERIALDAAKSLHYEFAGVDLMWNRETGKVFLLEANRSPEFEGFMKATGIDVPGEVMKFFLRFLGKKIE